MAKKRVPRPYNGGRLTEAGFKSYIVSALRKLSQRWGPVSEARKRARVSRGKYRCAECGKIVPSSYVDSKGKRRANIQVDHIAPVVDPEKGFVSWDEYIKRMFVEVEGLQVLCRECHDRKCKEERAIAKERRRQHGE